MAFPGRKTRSNFSKTQSCKSGFPEMPEKSRITAVFTVKGRKRQLEGCIFAQPFNIMLKASERSLSHANLESLLRRFDDIDAGFPFSRPVLRYAETVIDGVIRASGHDDMPVYNGDADVLMGDGRGNMRDILIGIHDIPGVSAVQRILYEDFFLDGDIVRHVQIAGDAVAFRIMDEYLVLSDRGYGKRACIIF